MQGETTFSVDPNSPLAINQEHIRNCDKNEVPERTVNRKARRSAFSKAQRMISFLENMPEYKTDESVKDLAANLREAYKTKNLQQTLHLLQQIRTNG